MTALSKEPRVGTSARFEDERDFADSLLGLAGGLEPGGDDQGTINLGRGARLGGEDGERFEIIEKIGSGAMGVVYLASDRELERLTAIKFVLQRGGLPKERLIADFYQEARAIAKLDHENILRIFDLGMWNGVPFIIVEHLRGRSLESLIRREGPSLREAIRFTIQIASGLAHAHEHGIVHRDLKPSNVFVQPGGAIKILDFGLAYSMSGHTGDAGHFGERAGTPAYMAPEQWLGCLQDARTDIWSLGIMLFEMLAGRRPFNATTAAGLMASVISKAATPSIHAFRPDIPRDIEAVLARALQKDRATRFQTAHDMRSALLAALADLDAPDGADRGGQTLRGGVANGEHVDDVRMLRWLIVVAPLIFIAYVAWADAGAELPFSDGIRAAVDTVDASLFRRPPAISASVGVLRTQRELVQNAVMDRCLPSAWCIPFEGTLDGQDEPWLTSQALAGLLAFSDLDADDIGRLEALFDSLFESNHRVQQNGSWIGWTGGDLSDCPIIEPTAWAGIAVARARKNGQTPGAFIPRLEQWHEEISRAFEAYQFDPGKAADGIAEFPVSPLNVEATRSVYATSLGLLFNIEAARDDSAARARGQGMAKWLKSTFQEDASGRTPGGWPAQITKEEPISVGVTLQVLHALLAARRLGLLEEWDLLRTLPPVYAERLQKRSDIFGDSTSVFFGYYASTGGVRSFGHVVRFMWYPWAIGTMLEWDKTYGDKASRRERLAVQRAMERMADLAKESFRDLPTTPTFRLSEFLYVLRSADDQRDSSP